MEFLPAIFIILQGVFAWFATGFDDAINFASVLSQAKTKTHKLQVYIGMIASFLVMLTVSIVFGEAITRFSEGYFLGISIRSILVSIAACIVFVMGYRAYQEAISEDNNELPETADEVVTEEAKKHWFKVKILNLMLWFEVKILNLMLPSFATKIFLIYQINSSDDIITNTSFFLALSHDQIGWFAFGLTIGVISMMGIIYRFSETLEKYPKYTAILMMISSFFILYFGLSGKFILSPKDFETS